MKIRPFIPDKDFAIIKDWLPEERAHAMWSANLMKYPLGIDDFKTYMAKIADRFSDSPFAATSDDGTVIGFFCYSLNHETNEGKLKFVVIDPETRGRGVGKQMLELALKYAFEITGADAVQLDVFSPNVRAQKCYKSVGFCERRTEKGAFRYRDEVWDRVNMVRYK